MNRSVNAAIKRVHNRVFRDGGEKEKKKEKKKNQGIKARVDKWPRLPEAIHLIIGIGELSNVILSCSRSVCETRGSLYSNNNSI